MIGNIDFVCRSRITARQQQDAITSMKAKVFILSLREPNAAVKRRGHWVKAGAAVRFNRWLGTDQFVPVVINEHSKTKQQC